MDWKKRTFVEFSAVIMSLLPVMQFALLALSQHQFPAFINQGMQLLRGTSITSHTYACILTNAYYQPYVQHKVVVIVVVQG